MNGKRKRSVPLKVEAKKQDTQVQVLTEEEFAELQEGSSYKPISTVKCLRQVLSNFEA